jgi:branched-chain amino acid transport system ATP-binding protein
MTVSDPILSVQGLHVSYGRVDAVRDVSFTVQAGSVVTLVGANGAGKSSIINAVSGMLRPKSGSVIFDGHDITKTPTHALVGRGLVQVPEGRQILSTLTIAENLALAGHRSGRAGRIRVDPMYERFPVLGERRSFSAGSLSGGEQQMLAIARALVTGPKVIMMDEPSMGLAPKVVDEVFAVIEQIRSEGMTVVLVEQNARRALAAADHGYVLQSGSITHAGPGDVLLADDNIVEAYLGVGQSGAPS